MKKQTRDKKLILFANTCTFVYLIYNAKETRKDNLNKFWSTKSEWSTCNSKVNLNNILIRFGTQSLILQSWTIYPPWEPLILLPMYASSRTDRRNDNLSKTYHILAILEGDFSMHWPTCWNRKQNCRLFCILVTYL